jgi:hypothetical protein
MGSVPGCSNKQTEKSTQKKEEAMKDVWEPNKKNNQESTAMKGLLQ